MPIKVGCPRIIRVSLELALRHQELVPRMRMRIVLFVCLATKACSLPLPSTSTTFPKAEPTPEHETEHTLKPELEPKFDLHSGTKPETTSEPEAELKPEPKLEPEPEPKPESEAETTFETGFESESETVSDETEARLGREPHSLSANLTWLQKRVHQLLRTIKLC